LAKVKKATKKACKSKAKKCDKKCQKKIKKECKKYEKKYKSEKKDEKEKFAKYGRDAKKRCPANPEKVYADCEKRILSKPLSAAQVLVIILIIVGLCACCCGCYWTYYCCNKRKGGIVTTSFSSGKSHGHKGKMKRKRRKKAKANSFDVSSFESYSSFELDLEYVGDGGETYGEPGYAVEGATTVIVIDETRMALKCKREKRLWTRRKLL
jgi:hypothetical protein